MVSFHKSVNGPLSLFIPLSDCAMEDIYCTRKKLVQKDGIQQTRPDTRHKMRLVCVLFTFENNTGPTDLRTDLRTDTTSYRDAKAHLKRKNPFSSVCVVMPSYLEGFPHAEFVNETASFMLLLPFWFHLISHLNDYSALWSKTAKNTD